MSDTWIFGYGSLIWRPDFAFHEQRVARLRGWSRRFWQGSHDHRGVPEAPGRVVTLVPEAGEHVDGVAYRIGAAVANEIFARLDHREKNGYARHDVALEPRGGGVVPAVVYVASSANEAWLGEAPLTDIADQIRAARGPSGANVDYLLRLADALRARDIDDPHVFALEALVAG